MLYFRMILIMLVTLYTSRVILKELGVVDYGIYNVVGGIVVLFSFLNGAMSQSTQRFLSYEIGRNNLPQLRRTFKSAITIHVIIAVAIVIIAESVGIWFLNEKMTIPSSKMDAANWVFQCSILSFLITILQTPFNACIISHGKMKVYAYVGIIEVMLKLLVAVSLSLFTTNKLQVYACMILLVTLIVSLIYLIYCRKAFNACRLGFEFNKSLFKIMSSFTAWNTLGSMAWMGKSQGVNIILNLFIGPAINAAYGIANQVNYALNSFVQNFSTAITPEIIKDFAAQRFDELHSLIMQGAKFSFYMILLLSFPILICAHGIMELWLSEVPAYTVIFTKLVIINSILESLSYTMGAGIQATGNIKLYQILVGFTILLNLPLSIWFLSHGYAPQVVFVISIAISFITIFERIFILKCVLFGFSIRTYFRKVIVPISGIGLLSICLYYLNTSFNTITQLNSYLILLSSMIVLCGGILTIGLTKKERTLILNKVTQTLRLTKTDIL